jgi:hypothetical protein
MGGVGISISSAPQEIVKDLWGNTKITQIAERDAERQVQCVLQKHI